MATNRDEYLDKKAECNVNYRVRDLEMYKKLWRDNRAKHVKNETYHCEVCKLTCVTQADLNIHLKTRPDTSKRQFTSQKTSTPSASNASHVPLLPIENADRTNTSSQSATSRLWPPCRALSSIEGTTLKSTFGRFGLASLTMNNIYSKEPE
jgi:hypothetical protein